MLSQLEYEGNLAAGGSEPSPSRPGPSREKSGGGGSGSESRRRQAAGAMSSDGSVGHTGATVARRAGARGTATRTGGEDSEVARAIELSLMQEAW
jgi:hypothetical protein